ncbi:MAG: DNA-3-methyladenine glycosylase family protein [Cytophagales bacterium]
MKALADEIREKLSQDPVLLKLINEILPKVEMTASTQASTDIYFALLDSIVSQQLSVKAADTIFKRFLSLFPNQYPSAKLLIEMPTEQLRSVGLSFQKAGYLKNTAVFFTENDFDHASLQTFSDEEIIKILTQIKGVGQWTVEMLLMFVMNRPDVFPYDDLVVRNNVVRLYELEGKGVELKKKILTIAEQWRPYRTVACKYIWRWKDQK